MRCVRLCIKPTTFPRNPKRLRSRLVMHVFRESARCSAAMFSSVNTGKWEPSYLTKCFKNILKEGCCRVLGMAKIWVKRVVEDYVNK